MTRKTGIVYSTVDGQTLRICQKLSEILMKSDHSVELCSIESFTGQVSDFELFIVGSSIRYGKHHPEIEKFVKQQRQQLEKVVSAFFSVNLVARKNNKDTADANPYVVKFLKKVRWRPDKVGVFAGRLNYKIYSPFDRFMIRLIMLMTGGPTDPKTEIEYTDWKKVKDFGTSLAVL